MNELPTSDQKAARLAKLRRTLTKWKREKKTNRYGKAVIADQTIEMIEAEIAREERRHIESRKCWCLPTLDFVAESGNQVWVHHEPN